MLMRTAAQGKEMAQGNIDFFMKSFSALDEIYTEKLFLSDVQNFKTSDFLNFRNIQIQTEITDGPKIFQTS
jgi:hypothetical protein